MPENKDNTPPKRGVGLRIFGGVLFFLGMLNIMFSMKAGLATQDFYIFMIITGVIIFAIGSLRNMGRI